MAYITSLLTVEEPGKCSSAEYPGRKGTRGLVSLYGNILFHTLLPLTWSTCIYITRPPRHPGPQALHKAVEGMFSKTIIQLYCLFASNPPMTFHCRQDKGHRTFFPPRSRVNGLLPPSPMGPLAPHFSQLKNLLIFQLEKLSDFLIQVLFIE